MVDEDDRNIMEVLTEEECWQHLESQHIGRLVVSIAGEPDIFPVNYVVHERSVVFLTAEGTKLAGAVLGLSAAFEIDAADPLFHTGWSVILRGRAEEVEKLDDIMEMESLPLQPWARGPKRHYVRITGTVTGRRIVVPGTTGTIAEH
jgi:uncharacterized protein